jgi:hypothetical protein
MELQIVDRLADETEEYEVVGRPYTTNGGKDSHVRVKKVDQPDVTEIRSWGAHERVNVKRMAFRPAHHVPTDVDKLRVRRPSLAPPVQ